MRKNIEENYIAKHRNDPSTAPQVRPWSSNGRFEGDLGDKWKEEDKDEIWGTSKMSERMAMRMRVEKWQRWLKWWELSNGKDEFLRPSRGQWMQQRRVFEAQTQ